MRWPRLRQAAFSVRVSGFNSLLEMRKTSGRRPSSCSSCRFQFSIGDAPSPTDPDTQYFSGDDSEYCFNSLLEMHFLKKYLEEKRCAMTVSILYWRCERSSRLFSYLGLAPAFQFSIGDALRSGPGRAERATQLVSILYWRCVVVRHVV